MYKVLLESTLRNMCKSKSSISVISWNAWLKMYEILKYFVKCLITRFASNILGVQFLCFKVHHIFSLSVRSEVDLRAINVMFNAMPNPFLLNKICLNQVDQNAKVPLYVKYCNGSQWDFYSFITSKFLPLESSRMSKHFWKYQGL